MGGLTELQLQEPLVDAMVALMAANLNSIIGQVNASYADAYTVDPVQQFLPWVPVPSTLTGGLPAVGIQELESEFEDDTMFSLNASHRYAVVAIIQNVDHGTLAMQLRRTMQAIAYVIQQDRLAGTTAGSGGVMRDAGGAMSVNFIRTVPGPLLGDLDPAKPETPPASYLSWAGLLLSSTRVEVS